VVAAGAGLARTRQQVHLREPADGARDGGGADLQALGELARREAAGIVGEQDFFDRGGAGVVDAFLATTFLLGALVVAGFAIQSVQRLRGEESSGRAEPVLATAIGRGRWAAGHLAVALGGSALSPFTHSPSLPGGSVTAGPLVALTAVAALLVAVGLAAFARRDVSSGA
jgi:putative exporter of polyketide antibiotics